jgi:hypothetical protein
MTDPTTGTAAITRTTVSRLTRDQAKILAHYAAGEATKTICVNTGFDMAVVGRVLDEHAGNDRARAHQLVLNYQEHAKTVAAAKGTSPTAAAVWPRTTVPTTPAAAAAGTTEPSTMEPGTTEPDAPAGDAIGALLDQAEASGDPRLQRAATKIRELVDGLRTDLAEHLREAQLRAEQAQLQNRLAQIKDLLRPRRTQPVLPPAGTAAAAADSKAAAADSKVVRAWAAEQGLDCPARGRLPGGVLAAYQRHHAGEHDRQAQS